MNVLHVNTWAILGGAGWAAYRLHLGLLAQGHRSRIVARNAVPGRDDMRTWVPPSPLWEGVRRLGQLLEIRLGLDGLADLPSRVGYRREAAWADVINLHNLHTYYFSLLLLPRLEREAPLVWTLHDMWALTGHCVYPMACERWLTGCGRCPNLAGPPRISLDTTWLLHRARQWVYSKVGPVLVTPSRWLLGEVGRAPLTREFRAVHIPYGLDLEVFRPMDRGEVRRVLRLDPHEKVLLVSAYDFSARRKGADLLIAALEALRAEGMRNVRLLVVGQNSGPLLSLSPYPVLDLGEVNSEPFMAAAYSAADLFVLPTRADNLPNGLVESVACGTPCVSFRVGGVPEVVRPGKTGWLAAPGDAGALARCLHQALEDDDGRRRMSRVCRAVAEQEYDVRLMARRYVRLYEELIEERRKTCREASPGEGQTP